MRSAATHDRPWRRPGAGAYARRRLRNLLRPPVTVYAARVLKDHDVPVTMPDGITLRVNVYRPEGAGPFPVLLSAHPYGKDVLPKRRGRGWSINFQYRVMNQSEPVRISSETGWEAPDPAWWTSQGYVVINADTRGAGTSQGTGSLLSDDEARDIAELIEWAGTQPWSNGRVGMLGVSYLAISQYKAAALNPPHLAAICPWEGFTDAYRDFMTPGGVVEDGFSRIWQSITRRVARLSVDIGKLRPAHPLRDEWWQSLTPDLAAITVPMLVCTSFSDDSLHSSGSMRAFELAGSSDKFAYIHRAPKWATFYGEEARQAQLQFFDRYLKRADVAKPPRVRLEVRERGDAIATVRTEHEWPLARTRWNTLPLTKSVTFDLQRDAARFDHTFDADTEVSGPMTLRAWVSLAGASDAHLFVGVEKWSGGEYVPFEGSYGYGRDRVATGRLRLALRKLAPSKPHQPEHSFTGLQPLGEGEVVEVQVALTSSSTIFRAGDSLRLLIAGRYFEPRNPLFGHFPAHYVPSGHGRCTVHASVERPSELEIPIIDA